MPDQVSFTDAAALTSILAKIENPEIGLPAPVFEFALGVVPMINVDLVVLDDVGRALWAWRDDQYSTGWHIPGSIIRLNETIEHRIAMTARDELSSTVIAEGAPRAIIQLFGVRGTFFSLVYRCSLAPGADVQVSAANERPEPGALAWFEGSPTDVYAAHHCYRSILPAIAADGVGVPLVVTVDLTQSR